MSLSTTEGEGNPMEIDAWTSISIIPSAWRTVFGSVWTIYISINVALYTIILFLSVWQCLIVGSNSSSGGRYNSGRNEGIASSASSSRSTASSSSLSSSATATHRSLSGTTSSSSSSSFLFVRSSFKFNFRSLTLLLIILASFINILWLIDPYGFEHVYPLSLRSGMELLPYALTLFSEGLIIALWKRITYASVFLQRIHSRITIGKYKYTLITLGIFLTVTIILNILLTEDYIDNMITSFVIRAVYLFCTGNFTLWGSIYGIQFLSIMFNKRLPSPLVSCFRYLTCVIPKDRTTLNISNGNNDPEASSSSSSTNPSSSSSSSTPPSVHTNNTSLRFLPVFTLSHRTRTSSTMVTHRRDMRNRRSHASSSLSGISLPPIHSSSSSNTHNHNVTVNERETSGRLSTASFTTTVSTFHPDSSSQQQQPKQRNHTSLSIAALINSSLINNNPVSLRHGSVLDAIIGHQRTEKDTSVIDSSNSLSLPYDDITRIMESRGITTAPTSGRIVPSVPAPLSSTTKDSTVIIASTDSTSSSSVSSEGLSDAINRNGRSSTNGASFMDSVILTRFLGFVTFLFLLIIAWFILFSYVMNQRYIGPWLWFSYFCVTQTVQLIAELCIVQLLWLRRPGMSCLSFLSLHRSTTVDELRAKVKAKAKLLDIWDDLQSDLSSTDTINPSSKEFSIDNDEQFPRDDIHNLSFFGLLKRAFGPRTVTQGSSSSESTTVRPSHEPTPTVTNTSILQNPLNYESSVPSTQSADGTLPATIDVPPPQPVFMRLQDVLASPELTARIMAAQMREFERLQAEHIVTQTELRQVINLSAKEAVNRMITNNDRNTVNDDTLITATPSSTTTTTTTNGTVKYQSPTVQHVVHNPLRSLSLFTPITTTLGPSSVSTDSLTTSTVSPSSPSPSTNSSPSPVFESSGDPATDATIKSILKNDNQQHSYVRRGNHAPSTPSPTGTNDDGLPAPFLQWLINEWPSTNNNSNHPCTSTMNTEAVHRSPSDSDSLKDGDTLTNSSSPVTKPTDTTASLSSSSFVFGGVRPEFYKRIEIKPKSFDISSVAVDEQDMDQDNGRNDGGSDTEESTSDDDSYENIVQRYISKALGGGKTVTKATIREPTNRKTVNSNALSTTASMNDNGIVRRVWNGKDTQNPTSSTATTTTAKPVVEVIKGDLTLSVNVALATSNVSSTGTVPSVGNNRSRSSTTTTDNAVPNPFRVLAAAVRAHHRSNRSHSTVSSSSSVTGGITSIVKGTVTTDTYDTNHVNRTIDNVPLSSTTVSPVVRTNGTTTIHGDEDTLTDAAAAARRKERQVQLIHNLRVHGLPVPSSLEESISNVPMNTLSYDTNTTNDPDDFGAGILLSENNEIMNPSISSSVISSTIFTNTPSPLTLGLIGSNHAKNGTTTTNHRNGIPSSSSSASASSRSERSRSVA